MLLLKKVFVTLRGVANHPLNRRCKMKAVWNFGVVQVAARLVPGDICRPFPNQTRLLISPSMKGATHFISPGLCEFEEMSFVLHFLRPDDLFVDVGANIGAYTILASGAVGARSVSVEPNPSSFKYLVQNVRLNNLVEKVTALNVALGREEGMIKLTDGMGTENYVSIEKDSSKTVDARMTTLDRILEHLNPKLIKIDVEGFEAMVLAGAKQTLEKSSLEALIIERGDQAARYGYDESQLHKFIQVMSFLPCAYSPLDRSLTRLPHDALGNIIYLKNLDAAQKSLREAKAFEFSNARI